MALGMTGAMVAGASFALFSSSAGSQNNGFTAGTVTLTRSSASTCKIGPIAPGDSGTCTYQVSYSGSLAAYVSLDVATHSLAGNAAASSGSTGSEALYDGTQHGLNIALTDLPSSASPNTSLWTGSVDCVPGGGGAACATATSDESGQPLGSGPVTNGWSDTVTVHWSLPLDSGNTYQGGSAIVVLTASAIQHRNNAFAFEGILPNTKGISTPTTLNGPGNVVNGTQTSTNGVYAYITSGGQFAQFDSGTWSFSGTIDGKSYTLSGPYRWYNTGTYGGTGCTFSATTGPNSNCVVENQKIQETLMNTTALGGVDQQWAAMKMVSGQPAWDVTVQATGPLSPLAGSTDTELDGDGGVY